MCPRGLILAAVLLVSGPAAAATGIDRLYVIDCGQGHAADQSRWSPGANVGVPIDLADNCYLIHHRREGYLLWDTGVSDRVAALPDGLTVRALGLTWRRARTLAASLAAIGVQPADVRFVAISHNHPDHTGNVGQFPDATVIMQRAEWDEAVEKPFGPDRKKQLIDGDKDLFGDGSAVLVSTPGHTPGHQSLLLHLERTGFVLLSGDVVHFQSNWDHRRIPEFNADKAQSAASMEKIAHLLKEKHAQAWINHDKPSSDARRHAPGFYD